MTQVFSHPETLSGPACDRVSLGRSRAYAPGAHISSKAGRWPLSGARPTLRSDQGGNTAKALQGLFSPKHTAVLYLGGAASDENPWRSVHAYGLRVLVVQPL